ncbi:YdcF family protein [Corynebacterium yudongzhengii]|uniref:YdcF family protein n=1 Tax=Corynebacterium yudongzhengii TaxID=2080740 RepID=A0A2U1T7I2_9CORY|nr:YdcF family protein [Corynebacterium yudongzhengii]PWC01952.1 YdcF family protein [Corynebacterium yudongzhengii]
MPTTLPPFWAYLRDVKAFRILALALPVVGALAAPVRIIAHQFLPRGLDNPDSIAVLGTAQYDGRPSRHLRARIDHARDLARKYPRTQVYTLGANLPGDRFTEAAVSARELRDDGIPDQRITEVPVGCCTRDSMEELLGYRPGSTLVVTDPNHALRAQIISRLAGIDAFSAPTPYCPSTFPAKTWWLTLAHEVGGLYVQDVRALAGPRAARRVEQALRYVEGWLRPSRRKRHRELRRKEGQ